MHLGLLLVVQGQVCCWLVLEEVETRPLRFFQAMLLSLMFAVEQEVLVEWVAVN